MVDVIDTAVEKISEEVQRRYKVEKHSKYDIYTLETDLPGTSVEIGFYTGAISDPKGKNGLTHLTEHVISEFPEKTQSAEINAYTGLLKLTATAEIPKFYSNDEISKISNYFENFMEIREIKREIYENEKEIVKREIESSWYDDEIKRVIYLALDAAGFNVPAGKEEDIASINFKDVDKRNVDLDGYKRFISVKGKNSSEIVEKFEDFLEGGYLKDHMPRIRTPKKNLIEDPIVKNTYLWIFLKITPRDLLSTYKLRVASFDLDSPLSELRKSQKAYGVSAGLFLWGRYAGFLLKEIGGNHPKDLLRLIQEDFDEKVEYRSNLKFLNEIYSNVVTGYFDPYSEEMYDALGNIDRLFDTVNIKRATKNIRRSIKSKKYLAIVPKDQHS